jgi:transcriptional regulator with XRE-family HTH domain
MTAHRPRSLADFLRACRERLRPADLGLPAGQRRRTPGLRREEVAALCGISPTWYTWLEQGRTAGVSAETLSALADGLRLSRAERDYLFVLAGRLDPAAPRATPAAPDDLLDRHWDAVAWNRPAAALFGAWLGACRRERNLLRYVFLDPSARTFIAAWPDRARRLVAEYRADTAAWQDDPVRQALVGALSSGSPEFAAAWQTQRVLAREGGQRRFEHPRHGPCDYLQHTLRVAQQPDLKLIVLVPDSTRDEQAQASAGRRRGKQGLVDF